MNPRLAALALVAFCAVPLRAAVEFSGYVRTGVETSFLLSDPALEKNSGWLGLGGIFEEHTVIGFDPQREVLSVERAGLVKQLPLRRPQMNRATASPEVPLPEVADAQRRREAVEQEVRTRREQRERALEQKRAMTDEIRRLGDLKDGGFDYSGTGAVAVSIRSGSATATPLTPFRVRENTDINDLVRTAGQSVTSPAPRADPRPLFYTESGGIVDFEKLKKEQEARNAAHIPTPPPSSRVLMPVTGGYDAKPPTPQRAGWSADSQKLRASLAQTVEEIQTMEAELARLKAEAGRYSSQHLQLIELQAEITEAERKKVQAEATPPHSR